MPKVLEIEELEDLMDEIRTRVFKANRQGELDELLAVLGMDDLIEPEHTFDSYKDGKIVIIAGSEVKESHLRKIAEDLGIGKNRLEFCLDYTAAQKYDYHKLQYNSSYRVIMFGAVPHSSTGKGDSSSVISEMEKNQSAYPRVIRLWSNGTMKITKTNFKTELEKLISEGYIE